MTPTTQLGANIKARRIKAGLSLADLGRAMDPPRPKQEIHRWESGQASGVFSLAQLAKILEVTVDDLLPREPDNAPR